LQIEILKKLAISLIAFLDLVSFLINFIAFMLAFKLS
jgi:hypothetical protein